MSIVQNVVQRVWLWQARVRAVNELEQTIRCAFARWKVLHPAWAATFFDEHFLTHKALPLLRQFVNGDKAFEPLLLVGAWADQFPFSKPKRRERATELWPAAYEFLTLLNEEICRQEQPTRWAKWGLALTAVGFIQPAERPCAEHS